jgi:hypothetical protein
MLVRLGFRPGRFQEAKNLGIQLRVTIQNDVPQRANLGKGLTQLLDDPLRRWVLGYVEMQDSPASVFDHEEAVQRIEVSVGTVKKSSAAIAPIAFTTRRAARRPAKHSFILLAAYPWT